MAKKQQIILTHGSAIPSADVIKDLKLGEVLVQHTEKAAETALHTVIEDEEKNNVLVSFPSKAWVEEEIAKVDAGGINDTIDGLDTRISDMDKAYKAADKTEKEAREAADKALDEAYKKADGELDTKFTGLIGDAVEDFGEQMGALEEAIGLKVAQSAYDEKMEAVDAAIAGFTDVLDGYAGKTSVKNAVDSKVAQSAYDEKMEAVDAAIKAVDDKFDTLENTFYTEDEIDGKIAEINGKIDAAKVNISGVNAEGVGVFVTETEDEKDGHFSYAIETKGLATSEALGALSDIVTTMQGTDAGKSIRAIADEEAAAAVAEVVANADTDFDTLKEVADWILSDTSGAAKLQTDVAGLLQVTNGYTGDSAIKTAVDAVDERVGAIEEDYLKAQDRTDLAGLIATETENRGKAIAAEAKAREDADKAFDAKLGGSYSADSTVADAIKAVDDKFDTLENTFYTEDEIDGKIAEINAAIAEAKVNISGVNAEGVGVFVTETEDEEDGHFSYTIEAKGLATSDALEGVDDRLEAVEGAYVKTIKYKKVDGTYEELAAVNNVIDLSGMVIDGGTY